MNVKELTAAVEELQFQLAEARARIAALESRQQSRPTAPVGDSTMKALATFYNTTVRRGAKPGTYEGRKGSAWYVFEAKDVARATAPAEA